MSVCEKCANEINRWIDAFQDRGPITGWRQYQSSPDARRRRSAEMYTARVNDRAALIRRQIALIRETCNHTQRAEEAA